jgi:hypothetical protein
MSDPNDCIVCIMVMIVMVSMVWVIGVSSPEQAENARSEFLKHCMGLCIRKIFKNSLGRRISLQSVLHLFEKALNLCFKRLLDRKPCQGNPHNGFSELAEEQMAGGCMNIL